MMKFVEDNYQPAKSKRKIQAETNLLYLTTLHILCAECANIGLGLRLGTGLDWFTTSTMCSKSLENWQRRCSNAGNCHKERLLYVPQFTHRVFGFNHVALGLFRGVVGHDGLGRLSSNHVTEDDWISQSTGPHIRREFRVLQLISVTVFSTPEPTFVELPRRKVAYSLVLRNSNNANCSK